MFDALYGIYLYGVYGRKDNMPKETTKMYDSTTGEKSFELEVPEFIEDYVHNIKNFFKDKVQGFWVFRGLANFDVNKAIAYIEYKEELPGVIVFNISQVVHWMKHNKITKFDEFYLYEPVKFEELKKPTASVLDSMLIEREANYGTFEEFSDICQNLTNDIRITPNWDKLSKAHKEALEMIVHKMSRILNGNPNYKDSWLDIAGYAKKGSESCQES